MKITNVSTHLFTGLWKDDPWFPQNLHSTALIRIETDSGIDGWGETTLGYFAGETVPALVEFFKSVLMGRDPMQLSSVHRALYDEAVWWARAGAGRSVLSGIELALWDIAGKALKVPVYQLLGGAVRDRIPVYASGGPACWPLEDNLKKVQFYIDQGYRATKLSTHFYVHESDPDVGCKRMDEIPIPFAQLIEEIGANFQNLRHEFGNEIDLAIDGHQGGLPNPIPVTEAIAIAEVLEPYHLRFFEEPLAYTDLDGYVELKSRSKIPIAGGESLSGLDQFHTLLGRNGLHMIQPDIGWVGGLQETQRIIHHAEATNVSTAIHTGASFGPSLAASWHLAAATQSVQWLEHVVASSSIQKELLCDSIDLKDGTIGIPSAPGLGVNITPELLDKYRFVAGSGERT